MHNEDSQTLVTTIVHTYDQERYIEQCIKGIVSQTLFSQMKILIIDDFSNDETLRICYSYQKKYPTKIEIVDLPHNQFSLGGLVGIEHYNAIQSKYLAWCDGDDYWSDSSKIEKQVAILECDPYVSIVHTNYLKLCETSKGYEILYRSKGELEKAAGVKNGKDFVNGNYVKHSTAVIAKDKIDFEFLRAAQGIYAGDWLTCVSSLRSGRVHFLKEVTTTVRITNSGMWNGQSLERNADQKERIKWFCATNLPESDLRDAFRRALVFGWIRNQLSKSVVYPLIRPTVLLFRMCKKTLSKLELPEKSY